MAPISVDQKEKNSIVIVGGANDLLSIEDIESASNIITQAKMLLCQLELPMAISLKAIEIAKAAGVFVILNPTPVPAEGLPEKLYRLPDILCVNNVEAETLSGISIRTQEDAKAAGKTLLEKGAQKNIADSR